MYIPVKLRQKVFEKYDGLCAYSGTPLKDDWQVDHVIPVKMFEMGYDQFEDPNDINNLMPVQRIINHYKRGLTLEKFKSWYLGGLHERLKKLPENPRVEKSIRHKEYLLEVAELFGIEPDKPFCGELYFEQLEEVCT
jgi:5-methylcytosine-specific restriction endonuclease McrA